MADKYSEIIQTILDNWLETLTAPEHDDTELEPELQRKIKGLIEQGDLGNEGMVKSLFKQIGS